jgi:hypothetical protein
LLEVVDALRACRCLTDFLDGGHQERDKNGDDGDHHQEFNQRESGAPTLSWI